MIKYAKLIKEFGEEILIDDNANLPLKIKGYYCSNHRSNVILLSKNIKTIAEKTCILAEEVGHYQTTFGDILDQSVTRNRKQEYKARRWAVLKLIRVEQFIDAFNSGVRNKAELAEFLEVTEEFIDMALEHFNGIYGVYYTVNEYIIQFDPLYIYKKF